MTLTDRLREYIEAAFTGLWIESHEHEDALLEIARLCRDENWRLATWDVFSGLRSGAISSDDALSAADPLSAIRSLAELAIPEGTTLLVLKNFHRFLGSAEISTTGSELGYLYSLVRSRFQPSTTCQRCVDRRGGSRVLSPSGTAQCAVDTGGDERGADRGYGR